MKRLLDGLRALPCDIIFGGHGTQFAMTAELSRLGRGEAGNPFIDPAGWQRLLAGAEKAFRDQLALEHAGK